MINFHFFLLLSNRFTTFTLKYLNQTGYEDYIYR